MATSNCILPLDMICHWMMVTGLSARYSNGVANQKSALNKKGRLSALFVMQNKTDLINPPLNPQRTP
jgi:hypothetical protein